MKNYLLATVILLVFCVICFLTPPEMATYLRRSTANLLSFGYRLADNPASFIRNYHDRLETLDQAQAAARHLRDENANLLLQLRLLQDKQAENDRLREMLAYKAGAAYSLIACHVTAREPSQWWVTVKIDVGWKDYPELKKDQPVVTPRGVVGKTGDVSTYTTDVILLVNENCAIAAVLKPNYTQLVDLSKPPSRDEGIAQGMGNLSIGQPRVKLRYLPKNSEVTTGQIVVSSGRAFFPAGLPLGTVSEVPDLRPRYPTFGLYKEVVIEPAADLNELNEVFVVVGTKGGVKDATSSSNP